MDKNNVEEIFEIPVPLTYRTQPGEKPEEML
jgi:hypothetical protein